MAQNFVSDGDVILGPTPPISRLHRVSQLPSGTSWGRPGQRRSRRDRQRSLGGVFTLPKVPAAVFEQGEKLVWSASAKAFDGSAATAAAGDITGAAFAWAAGSAGQATAEVRLSPGNATKA